MERRPLRNQSFSMLWKVLFLVVMELGIRNDLVDPDTGEDLAQGVGFWYAFLTSFWGSCVVVWLSFLVAVLVGPFVAVLVVVLLFAFV